MLLFLLPLFLYSCAGNRQLILADEFGSQGRWDDTYEIYREALRQDPSNVELKKRTEEVRKKAAEVHHERGTRLLDQQKILAALEEVKRAIALDPSQGEFQITLGKALRKREALQNVKIGRKLISAEKFTAAKERLDLALEFDPDLKAAKRAMAELRKAQKKFSREEFSLTLQSTEPITLKFQNAKLSEVFELLAKTSGINILFDKDTRPESVTLSIFIKDVTFKEALNLILTTNNLFMKKVSEGTILIIPKTKQKVNQYQDLMIRTFYLSNVQPKKMINILRTMLETRRIMANDAANSIIIRDTPDKLRLAEKVIEANDRRRAEVILDAEILEVNLTKSLKFGWNLSPPSGSIGITPPPGSTGPGVTLRDLRSITDELIFFTIPSIAVDFFKQESDAQTLANPRIRVLDREKAKINIGDRVPILLSTTRTAAIATGGAPTATTATNVQFKDVGIKINVEPTIHMNGDIELKISLEVTTLGDLIELGNGTRQFRFGNRKADTVLSVRDGETVVIGGLVRNEDRKTVNKIPGLGDIPFLGRLFSGVDSSKIKTDVLMTLTPHIVHEMTVPPSQLQSFWSGTESSFSTTPLFSELPVIGDVEEEDEEELAPEAPARPSQRRRRGSLPPEPPPPPMPEGPSSLREDSRPLTFSIEPSDTVISVDKEVVLHVLVDDAKGISKGKLSIRFDPRIISFKKGVEGELLKRTSGSTNFVASSRPGSGIIDVQIDHKDPEGIQGSGTLFSLIFKGERFGSGQVFMREAHLVGKGTEPIPVKPGFGVITVR